jgi:hypothetical protein
LRSLIANRLKLLADQKAKIKLAWPELTTEAIQKWLEGEDIKPFSEYYNRKTQRHYYPHHLPEWQFIIDQVHRYLLAKGGEGGGKSVAGIIRDLERIKSGAHGILVSPDFEHFKKSLWPEFRRWCPWNRVVEKQRYRQYFDWEPGRPFQLAFDTGALVYCGGIKETDVMSWEGPNVNWAHFDEPRRHKTAAALKVIDGRVRIPMGGFMPQIWLTTTPRKHWLYQYYGPWEGEGADPYADFKADAFIVTLLTIDNEENLEPGFVQKRRQSLTEAEARVLLEAEWEDIEDTEHFLPSMSLWDLCQEPLPPLTKQEPMVIALDAPEGTNESGSASSFGMVGVTRHPQRHNDVAVRFVQKWDVPPRGILDFKAEHGPEWTLRKLCRDWNVVQVAYDAYNLHSMMTELNKENIAWFKKFSQHAQRLEADKQLLDLILQRRIAHNGNIDLKQHIKNSNRKMDTDGRRLRIVKRESGLNVDLAVCLSMASYECLRLNL